MRRIVSWMIMVLFLVGTLTLAFNIRLVNAQAETIYINSDGSVSPSSAPISTVDNVTYTLTDNIVNTSITVERDDILIAGAGFALQGSGVGTGIDLSGRTNVTIQFMEIEGFRYEISLENSTNNNILNNSVTDSDGFGILIYDSLSNSIYGNDVVMSTQAIPEPGSGGSGICILSSNYTMVSGNTVENTYEGIQLQDSYLNNVSRNSLKGNYYGIGVVDSNCSNISENIVTVGITGIDLERCSDIIVSGNNITENSNDGVTLYPGALSNVLYSNFVENNSHGINLWEASSNSIFHNDFVNNSQQVYIIASGYNNSWDDGYPSGGNYWSDYNGADFYSGPYQNVSGSDGIGDTPYVINSENRDNYPLFPADKMRDLMIEEYQGLVSTYQSLNSSYNELQSKQETTTNTLNLIRNLMYIFIATTIIFIAATVYFRTRKLRAKPETKTT